MQMMTQSQQLFSIIRMKMMDNEIADRYDWVFTTQNQNELTF